MNIKVLKVVVATFAILTLLINAYSFTTHNNALRPLTLICIGAMLSALSMHEKQRNPQALLPKLIFVSSIGMAAVGVFLLVD